MFNKKNGSSLPLVILGLALVVAVGGYFLVSGRNRDGPKTPEAKEQVEVVKEPPKKDIPDAITELLTAGDIKQIEDAGMTVYKGHKPPNIDGSYQFDSLVVTYDSESELVGREVSSDGYEFFGQTSEGRINIIYNGEASDGVEAFVSGEGQCFTMVMQLGNKVAECDSRELEVTSACKTDMGLGQIKRAGVLKEKQGAGCGELIPVSGLRIVTEQDGLAQRIE